MGSMRVLLVSANTEQINMAVLPMGLACVAAAAGNSGHEVHFLNLMTRENSVSMLEEAIGSSQPELIGVSVRNIDDQFMQSPKFLLSPVKDIVAACRKASGAPVVLGGAGFSIFPQSTLSYLGADMGIRGEGEKAFVTLLDRMSKGAGFSDIPGLVLPGGAVAGGSRTTRKLDEFPLPVPNGILSFPKNFEDRKIWVPFQTRRGCPMECSYCSTPAIEGKVLRKRSIPRAVDSISAFVEAGFSHFFLVDNIFNLPVSYAKDFCDELSSRKLDIQWRCILYPWKVDEDLVEKMARAGCVEVSLGSESGSRDVLRSMIENSGPQESVEIQ